MSLANKLAVTMFFGLLNAIVVALATLINKQFKGQTEPELGRRRIRSKLRQ